jgi:S1-C subfamily serine protease
MATISQRYDGISRRLKIRANQEKVYTGTGFIVSFVTTPETLIVTNSHVLSKFDGTKNMRLDIIAANGDKLTYERTFYEDKTKDLAVLAVKKRICQRSNSAQKRSSKGMMST